MRLVKKNIGHCVSVAVLLSLAALAHAQDDPLKDPDVQRELHAMATASTWAHPDLFGEYAGMRHYAGHDYKGALKYFKIGALYADKLSQLSIGLMYMNGEGTPKDPVTAYAWLDLAAERDYPDFVATRDTLKSRLTPEQLTQAIAMRAKLAEKYGDNVAKHRLVVQLRQGQMQITGSHTGFDYGRTWLKTNPAGCGDSTIFVGGQAQPQVGCGGSVFAKSWLDPDLYFAARDREFKATVSVGAIQTPGKPIDKPPQSSQAKPPDTNPNPSPIQH